MDVYVSSVFVDADFIDLQKTRKKGIAIDISETVLMILYPK